MSDRDIAKIVEMGFTLEQASHALRETGNNVEEAVHMVLQWSDSLDSYSSGSRGYNNRSDVGGAGRGHSRGEQRDGRDTRPERGMY